MKEASRPSGLELLLSGVPCRMSDSALKRAIRPLLAVHYDFRVSFVKSSEDLFWKSFSELNVTNTARLIIPDADDQKCDSPGENFLRRGTFPISYNGKEYPITVSKGQSQETRNDTYDELRNTRINLEPLSEALGDGIIGDVRTISCGNFDRTDRFDIAYTWSPKSEYDGGNGFNKFAYYGDAFAKKFQVCLAESNPGEPFKWEWMDLHESNIRGIIFEAPFLEDTNITSRTVLFVVDKPPQFYQRTRDGVSNYVHTRISHPSLAEEALSYSHDVCGVAGVPWFIQYSRVYRIEYERQTKFTLTSYRPRLGQAQKGAMILLNRLRVEKSVRTRSDMASILKNNMWSIRLKFPGLQFRDCYLAILRLFYNCNVCPFLEDATLAIGKIFEILGHHLPTQGTGQWDPNIRRNICNALKTSSQDMETSHLRALRRMHAVQYTSHLRHPQSAPPVWPERQLRRTTEPAEALQRHLGHWYVLESAKRLKPLPLEVFEVWVYPSHVQIQGPVAQTLNSVIEEHRESIDRFIRVRFADNDEAPFRMEAGISPDSIIDNRIVRILKADLQLLLPIGQRFEFLGYSMSSLKKKKAMYFFRDDGDKLTAKTIRGRIGMWDVNDDLAKNLQKPSKWGARVALAFTESDPVATLSPRQVAKRPDVKHGGIANTDGCGLISPELCHAINQKRVSLGHQESQAFQIRFAGVKGVVYAGVQSLLDPPQGVIYSGVQLLPDAPHGPQTGLKMLLRESQIKFNTPKSGDMTLRLVSTAAEGCSSKFFAPVIKALEDSGLDTTKIEGIYRRDYGELTVMSRRGLDILEQLCKIPYHDSVTGSQARLLLLQLAIRLKEHNIFPEHYASSFLKVYLIKLAERAREGNLFEIPIPDSYQTLGLTDDYQILEIKEVYIRAKGQTRTGSVLIYRDPIIHIGDIQQATAVADDTVHRRLTESFKDGAERFEALTSMDNVIFFSQKDDPPFPNLLSGGDLDGDRFEILSGLDERESWLHGFKASPHNKYVADGTRREQSRGKEFEIYELAKFVGQYIRNDCFAELQDIHMCLADERKEGMKDPDVMSLANWLSQAVDYPKNGVKVDLFEDVVNRAEFRVRAKPDFLRGLSRKAFFGSKGEYYQSSNVLGKIYRSISQLQYRTPNPVDDATLQEAIANDHGFPAINDFMHEGSQERTDFEKNVESEVGEYLHYLEAQGISQASEIDVFMREELDNFPEPQLDRLSRIILDYMYLGGYVAEVEPVATAPRILYRVGNSQRRDTVDQCYRKCFFLAWETSLRLVCTGSYWPRHDAGFGRSFAYVCLHALYFRTLPVEDAV